MKAGLYGSRAVRFPTHAPETPRLKRINGTIQHDDAASAPKTLPKHIHLVELNSPEEFFDGKVEGIDGLVISAEKGYAWIHRRWKTTQPKNS